MGSAFRLFLIIVLAGAQHCAWAAGAMEYRYLDAGPITQRDAYQVAVLKLALEKTVAEYGPYSITRTIENYSTRRMKREVFEGSKVNVHVGARRAPQLSTLDQNIAVDVPIMGTLMGYRSLIVRREDLEQFRRIERGTDLKQLVAGLGRDWQDVDIFRYNGYRVDDRANLASLIPMLLNKRFDYLPMGIIEAQAVMDRYPDAAHKLARVPGILIYYPLPTVFYVSFNSPDLAARLKRGLTIARKDGSLDELLPQFFRKELQELGTGALRQIILHNPYNSARLSKGRARQRK